MATQVKYNFMQPCQQTENITDLKINMARFEEKLDAAVSTSARIEAQLAAHVETQKADQKELVDNLNITVNGFIEALKKEREEKEKEYQALFAGKWLERFVVRAGWIIITPILGGAVYFIFKLVLLVMAQG